MIYKVRKPILLLTCCVLFLSCSQEKKSKAVPERQKNALETFDDNKFGMFIHWGLYAIPAGEWKGDEVRGIGEWIMRRKEIPVEEYKQLAKQFNPTGYNPDEWAELAKNAGMKYLVITSKHHDGFAMFKSDATDYDIVDATPYGKDPMLGLSEACHERGVQFGFYYSQDQDWHEPNARGNTWDFPEERDAQVYINKKAIPQIKEILSQYGELALIWFDTPGLLSKEQVIELRNTVKTLQPNCLINSRIGHGQHDYFQTGDNAIPIQVYQEEKWEVPATLNDTWGFKKNDDNWKDPKDLICKLADIVSKGGNYLLNVGPTAQGVIPQESKKILRTIGEWLSVNGEAIYKTSASPFFFPDITWRCTVKPGKVYLHLLNWPGSEFTFTGLENKVNKAYFLANKENIPFSQQGNVLGFKLPAAPVDPYNTVMVLDIEGQDVMVTKGYEAGTSRDNFDLYAWSARFRGEELTYDWESKSVSNFTYADTYKNELWWYLYGTVHPGDYAVEITYACDQESAKDKVTIETTKGHWKIDREINFAVEDTKGKFMTKKIGQPLHIGENNKEIRLGLKDPGNSNSIRVQKIRLTRVK